MERKRPEASKSFRPVDQRNRVTLISLIPRIALIDRRNPDRRNP
jgi:hypothetical protein